MIFITLHPLPVFQQERFVGFQLPLQIRIFGKIHNIFFTEEMIFRIFANFGHQTHGVFQIITISLNYVQPVDELYKILMLPVYFFNARQIFIFPCYFMHTASWS